MSVDGLRPDAVTRQIEALPTFVRLRAQSAFTDNARTDPDFSNTLPNHTAQLTGRRVTGPEGHGWGVNRDSDPGATLHSNREGYLPSVFDVVHDHGLRTGLYASKEKFAIYERSYGPQHGAPDVSGVNNGRAKLDAYVYERDTEDLVAQFIADIREAPYDYAFVHLRNPDTAGHRWGWRMWSWHPYMRSVRRVDDRLGEILAAIESHPEMAGHTALIMTADHGGSGHSHGAGDPEDYIIPFYVWAPGVAPGDLYARLGSAFADPGRERPGVTDGPGPIRNGSMANLSLAFLGLDPVPGSTIAASGEFEALMPSGSEAPPSLIVE
ncbi:MAG: alkaline phosphatase family protein [Bacteroidota bacterium]